ncbi:MAG TPA: AAA family ATPase [Ktedonobacteraceae bacterium]|nr:AAA family ATPase [Ktedonobacteraceae bacterium]
MQPEDIDLEKMARSLHQLLKEEPNNPTLLEIYGLIAKLKDDYTILKLPEVQRLRELNEPPFDYAVFLEPSQHDPRAAIIGFRGIIQEVPLQGDLQKKLHELVPGQQVVLNNKRKIVALRDFYTSGEVAEVVNVRIPIGAGEILEIENIPPYRTKVRLASGEERDALCTPALARNPTPLKQGDIVRLSISQDAITMVIGKVKPSLHVKAGGSEGLIVNITDRLLEEGVQIGNLVRIDSQLKWAFEKVPSPTTSKLVLEEDSEVSYEDIGGLESQIDTIRYAIELPYSREVVDYFDLVRPKGILLYGPPGCGKTMIAKAIANSLTRVIKKHLHTTQQRLEMCQALQALSPSDQPLPPTLQARYHEIMPTVTSENITVAVALQQLAEVLGLYNIRISPLSLERELQKIEQAKGEARAFFKNVKGPELLSKWLGETERQVREIFEEARKQAGPYTPVIIFFDEIESLFRTRGTRLESHVEATTVPQFLAEMDGVEGSKNVMIIGASNREDMIDPAFLRPGRFDVKIKVDRPDQKAAEQILALSLTPHLPLDYHQQSPVPALGKIIFRTAYTHAKKLPASLASIVQYLPAGSDLRLTCSIGEEDIQRLATLPEGTTVLQAQGRQFSGALSSQLLVALTYFKNDILIAQIVKQLRAFRAAYPQCAAIVEEYIQREKAAEWLISNISRILYHQSSFLGVQAGHDYLMFPLRDFMNGALLANIVERAKREASKRALLMNIVRGKWIISWEDLKASIVEEFTESKEQMMYYKIRHEFKKQDVPMQGVELMLPLEDVTTNPWIETKFRPTGLSTQLQER